MSHDDPIQQQARTLDERFPRLMQEWWASRSRVCRVGWGDAYPLKDLSRTLVFEVEMAKGTLRQQTTAMR
jgi:hypothetical protein